MNYSFFLPILSFSSSFTHLPASCTLKLISDIIEYDLLYNVVAWYVTLNMNGQYHISVECIENGSMYKTIRHHVCILLLHIDFLDTALLGKLPNFMGGELRIIQCIICPFSSSTTVLPCYGPCLIPYQHIIVVFALNGTGVHRETWYLNIKAWYLTASNLLNLLYNRCWNCIVMHWAALHGIRGVLLKCRLFSVEQKVEDWVKSGGVMRSVSQVDAKNHLHPHHWSSHLFICPTHADQMLHLNLCGWRKHQIYQHIS